MSLNNLKNLGQVIDNKLEKLDKIWETPHMLISNKQAPDAEAQSIIENFLVNINKVHDELNELVDEQKESTADVERFVNECNDIVNNSIKPDCEALEDFLQKHGYTPLENINDTQISQCSILKDEFLDLSLLDSKIDGQDSSKFVVSGEQNGNLSSNSYCNNKQPSCIPTPVIKRLDHVRGLPREPIYSPYYKK